MAQSLGSRSAVHSWEERMRRRFIGPPFSPPVIVRGSGSHVVDVDGREYLDFSSGPGVLALGHSDEEVVAEIRRQAGILTQGPGKFLTKVALEYAEELAEVMPRGLERFFFANSGAEAVDGAIKLALKYSMMRGKHGTGIVAMDYAFHGRTALPLSLTAMPDRKHGFGPYCMFPGVLFASAPYHYRRPEGVTQEEFEHLCLDSIVHCLEVRAPGEISILIAEPILATGGIIVPPVGYWQKVIDLCHRHGVVVIMDEVFTGFGRTGRMFACEHWGVTPDIMTVGKAIGGGLPLSAFVTTAEIASAFDSGDHYTTFGANNVLAFAAGRVALKAIQSRDIVSRARDNGDYLLRKLESLSQRHHLIGEVRGKGLLVGVEVVADRESKRADPKLVEALVAELKNEGVLVLTSGYMHCTIRLVPPLTVAVEEIDAMVGAFDKALTKVARSSSNP